jgi:hypothetical protein
MGPSQDKRGRGKDNGNMFPPQDKRGSGVVDEEEDMVVLETERDSREQQSQNLIVHRKKRNQIKGGITITSVH